MAGVGSTTTLRKMSTTVMDCEFFYEREAEYFGFTPFQLLDQIGEIVVKTVYGMFDRVATNTLIPHAPFLSHGQVEAVRAIEPLRAN